jgi:CheY-like chemotaxis protein
MSTLSSSQLDGQNPKPTVLLIDTNLIVAEVTCMVLQNNNYDCINVGTVDEALQQQRFDVIISALHIEGDFDAVELIKQLHNRQSCPVIFLTG